MSKFTSYLRPVLSVIRRIRGLRYPEVNRQLSLFLVFLFFSVFFWFVQVCREESRYEISYALNLTNVPQNVIITTDIPDTIKVAVTDYVYKLLGYYIDPDEQYTIDVDFSKMTNSTTWKLSGGGFFTIDNSNLRRIVTNTLQSSTKVLSITPSSLDVYYSTGESKRVPVRFSGSVKAAQQHIIQGTRLVPDSVDVYATYSQLDTLREVYTEYTVLKDLRDSLRLPVKTMQMTGVKAMPSTVTLNVDVERYTEKTIQVPILAENLPEHLVLRTFPVRCEVTCQVSISNFDSIKVDDFLVVVDYNSLGEGESKCPIRLVSSPKNVTNVRVNPKTVECIVEELPH